MIPSMQPKNLSETLLIQYHYTSYVFATTLTGLSEKQGFLQPGLGVNCLNWVAGHVLQTRGTTLSVLNQNLPFANNKYDRYKRATKPISNEENTISLTELIRDFDATNSPLQIALQNLSDEQSNAIAPFSPFNNENETIGSLVAGLLFHESYHCGQLGILRRLAEAEGIIK